MCTSERPTRFAGPNGGNCGSGTSSKENGPLGSPRGMSGVFIVAMACWNFITTSPTPPQHTAATPSTPPRIHSQALEPEPDLPDDFFDGFLSALLRGAATGASSGGSSNSTSSGSSPAVTTLNAVPQSLQ